jgi:hypothetical protein
MMTDCRYEWWIDRSHQRWKLNASANGPLVMMLCGVYLFLRAQWPTMFYGMLLGIAAAPLAVALASFIRCRVCGHRVTLGAPFGRWYSYTVGQKACPVCGDDGEARPVSPDELPAWFQAAREVAARERARARVRRRLALRLAAAVAVIALLAWAWIRFGAR